MKIGVAHLQDTHVDECRTREEYVVLHGASVPGWWDLRAGDVLERRRVHYPYGNNCGDRRVFRTDRNIPVLREHHARAVTMDVYVGAYGAYVGRISSREGVRE